MIRKSKLGAIALIATMGLALPIVTVGLVSPSFAANPNSPALTGGGSTGYNTLVQTFRLKHHPAKSQTQHHQAPESDIK
jgi:hypothetical protein